MIPVNMSTITAVKNRLLNKGIIKTVRFPRMDRIGSDIVFGWWADLLPKSIEANREELGIEIRDRFPEVFFCLSDIDSIFCLGFARTYPELKERMGELSMRLSHKNIIRYDNARLFAFPHIYTEIDPCFNYSVFLKKELPLEMILTKTLGNDQAEIKKIMESLRPEDKPNILPGEIDGKIGTTKLRIKEKKVLYGLVKDPMMPDEQTGRMLNVTRQMVSRSRKELEKKDLLKTVRIPALEGLGVDIIAVLFINFRPDIDIGERQESTRALFANLAAVFTIQGKDKMLAIFPCMNLGDFKRIKKKIMEQLTRKGSLLKEPWFKLLSVSEGKIFKDFVFAPYLLNRFEIEMKD